MTTINLELAHKVLQDKSTSFWMQSAIQRMLTRDPVDVQNEIEVLNKIFMGNKA